MRTLFTAEMSELADDLIAMGRHVETAINRANEALLTANVELAQSVIADDARLDDIEETVDERCVLLIAQQQPVGLDLRTIISALRISAALERMGDLAQHIAEAARRAYPESAIPESHHAIFEGLAAAAAETATAVVGLLETRDLNAAAAIVSDDDKLDDLHSQAYQSLLDPAFNGTTQETLDIALMARFYERIGDHAVGISRRIVYLVTGDHKGDRARI
ncbi:phosphate signaling complex protein PhoU [Demequina capsici]|uniref:Phosphate-specific transport system accessory protein PhoU n=1 Tax=Demequina capsici TaxID=3075620 RepID=A0AA96FEB4_9MICO|nr:phosphate signaling complex protein PhoU [Demequina sp. PMTSA13]WNM27847.1 phosphate signaling complex protein PhoU [Demequina sp. PMTSA13]